MPVFWGCLSPHSAALVFFALDTLSICLYSHKNQCLRWSPLSPLSLRSQVLSEHEETTVAQERQVHWWRERKAEKNLHTYVTWVVQRSFSAAVAVKVLFCLWESLSLGHFKSHVAVSPSRRWKYISLCLLLQKSINHSVGFGNLVPSLAVFRSQSYFRAGTYTACIKIE